MRKYPSRLWVLVLLLALGLLPLFAGEYYVNLSSQMLIAVIFASSLNLLVGYAGLTSLGHATYLGLSAYFSAWLGIKLGLGHAFTAPLAMALTTLVAMVFGWIALRATGLGFLMLTLALSQIIWGLAYRWVSVTNGDNGLSGLTRPTLPGIDLNVSANFYWFSLVVTTLCVAVIYQFANSPFGASIEGTKHQARRMSAMGYNVWVIRWITYVVAGFFGAVAGLLYVYFNKYIHPSVFSIATSAEVLLCVIAGGASTIIGPMIGAVLIVFLKSFASAYIERWTMLMGFVFLLIVMFLPQGLVFAQWPSWLQFKGKGHSKASGLGVKS